MSDQDKTSPPPGAPAMAEAAEAFSRFCTTIAWLRDPKNGCTWDCQQDHASLRRYMIEEAYEAAEVMTGSDAKELCDELGDVLLQVVLNAQVALDGKEFSIVDVINGINAKMRRRHPHVFGENATGSAAKVADIKSTWEEIKAAEQASKGEQRTFAAAERKGPATSQALKIGKIASKINFDWAETSEVLAKVREEVDELSSELKAGQEPDQERVANEIGDVYFSLAQLCRHLNLDPETTALEGNRKFLKRFAALEDLARARGVEVAQADQATLEELWQAVKK